MSRGDTTTGTTLAHSATIDVVVVVCLFVTFSVAPVLTVVIVVSVVVKITSVCLNLSTLIPQRHCKSKL